MKLLFTFSLLLLSLVSLSQIQNENGKLILETNDTIVGWITYYDDLSSTVTYKDDNDIENSCTIDCINEIILNNGIRYTTINYPDHKNGKVFVQKIISSKLINLFASEENGSTYYYVIKDSNTYRLENNYIIVEKDNKSYSRWDYKYLGTLKLLMSDKPELFDKIDKLKLNENDLVNIIIEYNQGDINYFMTTETAQAKSISNWVTFGQYSNFGTYYSAEATNGYSYGIYAGLQLYFTRNHRHSLKFGLGYSHYELKRTYAHQLGIQTFYTKKNAYAEVYRIGITYEYLFFMTQRTNIYGLIHLGDYSYITEYEEESGDEITHSFLPKPTLSPGVGIEYKTLKKLSFYFEFNHLLNISYFPKNFSAGIKYDIGKITRN